MTVFDSRCNMRLKYSEDSIKLSEIGRHITVIKLTWNVQDLRDRVKCRLSLEVLSPPYHWLSSHLLDFFSRNKQAVIKLICFILSQCTQLIGDINQNNSLWITEKNSECLYTAWYNNMNFWQWQQLTYKCRSLKWTAYIRL